jgi:SPP1 family predicted phage head-tail adaptor
MMINPGELNKKIKFVTITSGYDSDGYPVNEEESQHECWAKVTNTSGSEAIKANAELSEIKTRFLIRYTSKSINRSWVVKFDSGYYDIEYINDYGHSHEYIEILASLRR